MQTTQDIDLQSNIVRWIEATLSVESPRSGYEIQGAATQHTGRLAVKRLPRPQQEGPSGDTMQLGTNDLAATTKARSGPTSGSGSVYRKFGKKKIHDEYWREERKMKWRKEGRINTPGNQTIGYVVGTGDPVASKPKEARGLGPGVVPGPVDVSVAADGSDWRGLPRSGVSRSGTPCLRRSSNLRKRRRFVGCQRGNYEL